MTRLKTAAVLFVLFLLWGCQVNCPAFPDSQMVWFPQKEKGDTLTYSNGRTTFDFVLEFLDKSAEHSYSKRCKCMCDVNAGMSFVSNDLHISYFVNIYEDYISLSVYVPNGDGKNNYYAFGYESSKDVYTRVAERLEYMKIGDKTYYDVLVLESAGYNPGGKVYFAKKYGVIRFVEGDEVWDLVG